MVVRVGRIPMIVCVKHLDFHCNVCVYCFVHGIEKMRLETAEINAKAVDVEVSGGARR